MNNIKKLLLAMSISASVSSLVATPREDQAAKREVVQSLKHLEHAVEHGAHTKVTAVDKTGVAVADGETVTTEVISINSPSSEVITVKRADGVSVDHVGGANSVKTSKHSDVEVTTVRKDYTVTKEVKHLNE